MDVNGPFVKLQMQQLQLSCNARFVQAEKSGHFVHAVEPGLIAREIADIFRSACTGAE